MTTKQLEERVRDLGFSGYGHHKIEITYRGKSHVFTTSNTLATDRLKSHDEISDRTEHCFYTYKEALQALYNEGVEYLK